MLRESKQINEDILGMFGVDPDPSVTTARAGFGEVSDTHARGGLVVMVKREAKI